MTGQGHSSIDQVPAFPSRADNAHKGDVGRLVIVGGRFDELGMVGAPALAANAAFRTGAGLVQVLTTEEARLPISILAPCATTRVIHRLQTGATPRHPLQTGATPRHPQQTDATPPDANDLARLAGEFKADAVAIGPGLDPSITAAHVVGLMRDFQGGIVIDADALNALAAMGKWRAVRAGQVVITPHPGEMKRLMVGLGLDTQARADKPPVAPGVGEPGAVATGAVVRGAGASARDRNEDRSYRGSGGGGSADARRSIAEAVVRETDTIVVLKGAGTVVTDGARTYVNTTGHSGMATGGAGDVLTGVILALMGQKMTALDAAVLGVYLHGRAGEIAANTRSHYSVTACDIVEALPAAIVEHRA